MAVLKRKREGITTLNLHVRLFVGVTKFRLGPYYSYCILLVALLCYNYGTIHRALFMLFKNRFTILFLPSSTHLLSFFPLHYPALAPSTPTPPPLSLTAPLHLLHAHTGLCHPILSPLHYFSKFNINKMNYCLAYGALW